MAGIHKITIEEMIITQKIINNRYGWEYSEKNGNKRTR